MTENKVCTECNTHSEEWSLSKELAKSNKRMFITLIVVIALWFSTIAGFVWYLNQYDFTSKSVTVDSEQGDANYIGNDGDIYNGTNNSQTEEENQEKPQG